MHPNQINDIPASGEAQAANDDSALFKRLTRRPSVAWPTLLLLVASAGAFAISTGLYATGVFSLGLTICVNAIAAYAAFTVGHDASHNALSANRSLNDWCGRLSTVLLSPIPFFRMFRYIHMQHHRFTNDPQQDPDMYCGSGSKWTLPLRWATLDIRYFRIYLRRDVFGKRPASEQREFMLAVTFAIILVATMIAMGWGLEYLLVYFVPTRLAIAFLAFSFDFLPHYPHEVKGTDDPYLATSNRVGLEWLLTPVLLFQNYHLVHHLYPTVPFYRYIKVWRARESFHRSRNPAETAAFGLGTTLP
jgi:fatty acid desaturase